MTGNDDFKTLRRHTRQEAAAMLNINDRWLREWVSENRVPNQRKGKVRGVWFANGDIRTIGKMLTGALMSTHQANARAQGGAAVSMGTDAGGRDCAHP